MNIDDCETYGMSVILVFTPPKAKLDMDMDGLFC